MKRLFTNNKNSIKKITISPPILTLGALIYLYAIPFIIGFIIFILSFII